MCGSLAPDRGNTPISPLGESVATTTVRPSLDQYVTTVPLRVANSGRASPPAVSDWRYGATIPSARVDEKMRLVPSGDQIGQIENSSLVSGVLVPRTRSSSQ